MSNRVKYYPVGNGDQSLIILDDNTTIGIDCHIRNESVNCSDGSMCDVKKNLLTELKRRDNNPFIDVFILTHGDRDHCGGFKTHYYQGDPTKYGATNRGAGQIIIDEMWFSPMIAEEHTNPNEDAYQQEAERRLALHCKKDKSKDLPGNRIRIVGYDHNKDYKDLNHLRVTPGQVITRFNEKDQDKFSFFIHAPFKQQLLSAEKDKNSNSIVFQARFKEKKDDKDFSALLMFGGDADYIAWEIIIEKTIESGKDESEEALDWDIFLAPHHCSWTFFNEHDNKDEPTDSSIELLKYRRTNGIVIASSKKIEDDEDNPPSYLAKQTYLEHLDNSKQFVNTAVEPKESAPAPIEFLITAKGPVRQSNETVRGATTAAGGTGAASTIVKQG